MSETATRPSADQLWGLADLPFRGVAGVSPDERRRLRMLTINLSTSFLCSLPLIALHFGTGDHVLGGLFVAMNAVLILNLAWVRRHRNAEFGGAVATFAILVIVAGEAAGFGGLHTAAADFLYLIPVIGTVIASFRVGVGATIATAMVVAVLYGIGPPPPAGLAESEILLNSAFVRLLNLTGFAILLWMIGIERRSLNGLITATRRTLSREHAEVENRLVDARRIGAIGSLSASLAHELNNPLTTALGNAELALESHQAGDHEAAARHLAEIDMPLERIVTLVGELRSYSRVVRSHSESVDINTALQSALGLTGNELKHRAQLAVYLEAESPVARGAIGDWTQVFVHLLNNAIDAIEPGDSENNSVSVSSSEVEDGWLVSVEDSGAGIPEAILDRVCEPFFTTKPVGSAAGLGLFVVKNFVEHAGGRLELHSGESGTRVSLWFPAVDTDVPTV